MADANSIGTPEVIFAVACAGMIALIIWSRYLQGRVGHSPQPERTPDKGRSAAASGEATKTERTVVTKSESSKSGGTSLGNIVIGILLAVVILWLALGGWATVRDWFVSLGESQSLRDQKAIPGSGFSAAVAIPQGYVICQYAELGDDSFTAEYQGLGGGEWLSLPGGAGGIASAIRWQSTSRPQVMYYLFVRPSEPCPRTW